MRRHLPISVRLRPEAAEFLQELCNEFRFNNREAVEHVLLGFAAALERDGVSLRDYHKACIDALPSLTEVPCPC